MPATTLTPSTTNRPSLGVAADSTVLEATADPSSPGAGVKALRRVSEVYPAPTVVDGLPAQPWNPSSVTRSDLGYLHVYLNGVDYTVVRGAQTLVEDFTLMDPFGCGPAHFRFPRVTGFDTLGTGDIVDLHFSASVDLYLAYPGGGRLYPPLWSGEVTKFSTSGSSTSPTGTTVECVGDLSGPASLATHKPLQYVPLTDRGTLIVRALNSEVVTRRTATMPVVATGHSTAGRGSSDQSVMAYVQSILPLGWTVRRKPYKRSYELAQRTSGTHPTWTVRFGQRGVDVDLSEDLTQAPNIIYGRGVAPSGYAWANWRYPGFLATQPAYPNTSPANTIVLGETDADTDSGTGVSDIQRRINELNITSDVTVTGTFDTATENAIKKIQDRAGITVDGIVGPQTWNAMWPLYSGVQVGSEVRLTIAGDNRLIPKLYAADGTVIGANPTYRTDLLRIEQDINYGSGITKAVGEESAGAQFQLTTPLGVVKPGWVGTVTFRTDPNEGSRFLIREGDTVRVRNFQGADHDLHVSQVQARPSDGAGQVVCTVDELARDAPTVAAIIRQDEDSKDDPLRLPGRRARRSQTTPDAVEPFDGESSAGIIPRIPLFASLWTVQAIPLSAAGKIARITLATTPPCAFYVAFFGDTVTAETLTRYVGDPTATDSYGRGPYQPNQDTLERLGFVDAVGGPTQAAGFSPGQETSPWDGASASPLTGRLDSQAPISYQSTRPPWLWVAFYAADSCYIEGRILPGPIDG